MAFPRWVHKTGGHTLLVSTADAYTQALAEGWAADPVPMALVKGDEAALVYTADALRVALAHGWTRATVNSKRRTPK